jgi:hypothetical protein
MYWIAHRGNRFGPNKNDENKPEYILQALKEGFDVEIDVWYVSGKWFLGHDKPQYEIDITFLKNKRFWVHCKSSTTYDEILRLNLIDNNDIHIFLHDKEPFAITSKNMKWVYPGQELNTNSICVMPECTDVYNENDLKMCKGICSDYVGCRDFSMIGKNLLSL